MDTLDGHSSHYNPEAVRLARDNDVILFTLVLHMTHEMQPLDTAVFGPLKRNWQRVSHDFLQSNPGKVITKFSFSSLLNKAWMDTMLPQKIINPYNPRAVLDHDIPENPFAEEPSEIGESKAPESSTPQPEFSEEEEALFCTRYEEGYNIYSDPKFVAWLKLNHPEDLGTNSEETLAFGCSVIDYFSSVQPTQ